MTILELAITTMSLIMENEIVMTPIENEIVVTPTPMTEPAINDTIVKPSMTASAVLHTAVPGIMAIYEFAALPT